MARQNFDVEVPDGTHLGFSRDTDGAYRAHLFDDATNELVGHAELFEPDPGYVYINSDSSGREEEAEWSEILGALALLGVIVGAQKAAPHVKQWWNDKALPFLKDKRAKFARSAKEQDEVVGVEMVVAEPVPAASDDVLTALAEYRASMSSDEARHRFAAALVARLFSEKQFDLLRNARVEDERGSLELASAMDALTPQQLEDGIRTMLAANPSWPDRETVAELGRLLNGRFEEPEALPVRIHEPGVRRGKHRHQE